MRHHFTSTTIAIILKRKIKTSVVKGVEKLELLGIVGGNRKWYIYGKKQFGGSSKM